MGVLSDLLKILFGRLTGGELFDLIVERGHLTERDAAVKARALLEVIQHCHSRCGTAGARMPSRHAHAQVASRLSVLVFVQALLQRTTYHPVLRGGPRAREYVCPWVLCHCRSRAEGRLRARRGVVHRDLKPENFLLKAKHATVDHPCTQHNVRCIDFGSGGHRQAGCAPSPGRLQSGAARQG